MNNNTVFDDKTILITGAAGFIGAALAKRVCTENPDAKVIGFDSVNDYYDVRLKEYRLKELESFKNFEFIMYSTPNTAAWEMIEDEELKNSEVAFPGDDVLKRCTSYTYLGEEGDQLYNDMWKKVKTGE